MKKLLLVIALFTCFLIGCSNEYEIKVVLDEDLLTYKISNNEFNVDDIEKKENYDYFDLYLDPDYQTPFDGVVNGDLTLYLKYVKYYNVTIQNNNDQKIFKVLENNYFDESLITLNENEVLIGLYYDNAFTKKYNQEIIENDLTLYPLIKKEVEVNIYDKDKFITTMKLLEGDDIYLASYELNPRYQNIKYYLDSEYQVEYQDKFDSTDVYIKYDINESLNDIVVLLIYGDNFIINHQINKGDTIKDKDLIKMLDGKIGYSANYNLYIDSNYEKSFNYGPVYEDLILYVKTYKEVTVDLEIRINYSFDDYSLYYLPSNTAFNVDKLNAIPDKYFYGLYWDKDYTKEYNNEILTEYVELYALYKDTPKEGVVYHTVNVYIADGSLGLEEIKKQNDYFLTQTFYIEDGKYIPNLTYRVKYFTHMMIHAFYKDNYDVPYYEDIITEDLELYCIYNEHAAYVSTISLEKEEIVINGEVINYYYQRVDEE